jgi:peroxidase
LSGDHRHEDNANLMSIQHLFYLEHTRISDALTKLNPSCSDERIFQETRRILIALEQKFFYNDWLPIALGPRVIRQFSLVPTQKGQYSKS